MGAGANRCSPTLGVGENIETQVEHYCAGICGCRSLEQPDRKGNLGKGNSIMQVPQNFHKALGLNGKVGPITALHVFDFDGTLVRTPGPEEGRVKYEESVGVPLKGGWWGNVASLRPPVIESPFPQSRVITSVFDEMEHVIARSQTSVGVVVTGRIRPLRKAVLDILDDIVSERGDSAFLRHDAVFTHPGGHFNTLEFKTDLFTHLLTNFPLKDCAISHLHVWEDRQSHADVFANAFANHLRTLTGIETIVHLVADDVR